MIAFDSLLARAFATLLLLAAPAAQGSDDREPIRSVYEADPACPPESRFVEEIFLRTGRARLATKEEPARTFHSRIRRRGSKFVGELRIGTSGGTSEAREISAVACDRVVSALALFAALAIDPRASVAEHPEESSTAVDRPTETTTTAQLAPPQAPETATPALPASPPDTAQPTIPNGPAAPPASWKWRVGAQAFAMFAAAPKGLFGGSLVATTTREPTDLRFRLSLGYAQSPGVDAGPGTAEVLLPNAGASVCPLALRLSSTASVWWCAGSRAGLFVARGSRLAAPEREARAWIDLEAVGMLEWRAGSMWAIEAGVGVGAPLTRYTLVFHQPETLIYEPAAAGLWTGLGVTWGR
jgi:hypothetical protein